ncbi:Predicted oxidoreductase, contains short-chain dehydrogenase (SDR) and DUF2520 domains [Lachnospiraceae bacterium NE2001]|nr:Predicted oxidoreductase, contains short-chain dehydrogenase (SDR) and DUF2520 domains [Lachnospiraceae bacterium NE2001]
MRIGFIGAGRVGFTMGKYLKLSGLEVTGYYSRNPKHAEEAATFTDTSFYKDAYKLIDESDAIILTVSDGAISEVFSEIKSYAGLAGKIVCHTSGSLASSVFTDTEYQVYGYSIHPIYAISDRYESYKEFSNAYLTIEGDEKYLDELTLLLRGAGLKIAKMSGDEKTRYHAACVMASNLVCGMYGAAVGTLISCGFDKDTAESMLSELFKANALGIVEKGLTNQLTGPIDRNDVSTVTAHLATLDAEQKKLYVEASKQVLSIAKEKNPDTDYTEMEKILNNLK